MSKSDRRKSESAVGEATTSPKAKLRAANADGWSMICDLDDGRRRPSWVVLR